MNLFGKLIPAWIWFAVIGGLLVLLAGQTARVSIAKGATAKVRAEFAEAKTKAVEERLLADRAQRHEEQRRADAARKVLDDARKETATALADAAAADAARDGVRRTLDLYIASVRARLNSTAGGRGQSLQGADPLDMLSGLFTRSDSAAGELARYADALRIAGRTCERQYDSLKP
jgi:hypothetical protein